MERNLDLTTKDIGGQRMRREIGPAGEPRWMPEPEIVVRQRATILEPPVERERERQRDG